MRPLVTVLAIALAVALAPPAAAQVPERVRVEAPGGSILVHGEFPPTQSSCVDPVQPLVHERYRGAVEVLRVDVRCVHALGGAVHPPEPGHCQ